MDITGGNPPFFKKKNHFPDIGNIYWEENDWKRNIFIKDYQTFIWRYDKFNSFLIDLCGCLNDTDGYISLQLK